MPPPQGISRRQGTTDHGSSYEQKIAALLGVKCALHDEVEDMWIATNVDGLGAFDDLVLFLQKKDEGCSSKEVYLIQIKYKNNGIINLSKRDNELMKYQRSFLKIKEDFLNDKSFLTQSCDFKNIKFLLFTNTKIISSNNLTFAEYKNCNDFINTGQMFQIPYNATSSYDPDFLNQTFFYYNQVEVLEIQNIIKSYIDKYFINCSLETIIKFFEDWHSEHFEKKEALEIHDIQSIILEVVLSNYVPEPILSEFPKAKIWNEVASQFQYTFLKEERHLSKIWQGVKLLMCNYFDDQNTDLLNWNKSLTEASTKVNKIKHCSQRIKPPIKKVKSSYSTKDLYLFLWHVCELPLILNLNTTANSQIDICKALSKLNTSKVSRRYIFLGQVTSDLSQYSTHFNILHSDRDIQETVLKSSYVSLQGKEAVTLKELKISDAALEKITPEVLIELLQPITKKVEDDSVYISRFVRQPVVAINALTIPDAVFVILVGDMSVNYQTLKIFGQTWSWQMYKFFSNKYVSNSQDFFPEKTKNIILNKDAITLTEYNYIENIIYKIRNCKDQTVHYLKFLDESKLEWLHSNKNADKIKLYLVSNSKYYLSDVRLFEYLTFNILSANTGEGKSTLLQFLANHSPTDVWVVKLNIVEIDVYTKMGKFSQIKKFLYQQSIEMFKGFDEFWWELFQGLYDKCKMLVIIDGIDEIEYNENIDNFLDAIKSLGIKTILAARPSLKDSLEKKFEMPILSLEPFTNEDCKLLIKLSLQNSYNENESHVSIILERISTWNNAIGVPLLLKLFVTLFSDNNVLDFNQFDISDLFNTYITQQLKKVGSNNESTLRTLSRYALFVLYREDAVSELITIEEFLEDIEDKIQKFIESRLIEKHNNNYKKTPAFAHRSLAEFLVARYLHLVVQKRNDSILQKFLKSLFYQELETVRLFFDIIALKDSGLQDVITCSNPTDLCNVIRKDSVDKFGRHALHIAASYGDKCELRTSQSLWSGVRIYELYNNIPHNNIIQPPQICGRRSIVSLNFVYDLLEKGLNPYEKDNLFKMDAFEFAIESGSLKIIETLFNKNFKKQLENVDSDVLLFHTVKNGCINVFRELKNKNYNLKILPALDNLLHIALSNEHFDIIKGLTEGAIPIDEPNNFGYTPLISWLTASRLINSNEYLFSITMKRNLSLNDNQSKILRHLINKKTNLNAVNGLGEAPLHEFCASQERSLVELLIESGAEVNKKTNLGNIPLHYASVYSLENVKLLLKHNSIIDISDVQGYTPLGAAVSNNQINIVKYLIKKGANVNRSKKEINNPLNVAVARGHVECTRLLLEKRAKINNSEQNNTMHIAVLFGDINCIKLLLEKGSRVDQKLLHLAICSNQEHLIKFLLHQILNDNVNINMHKLLLAAIPINNIYLIDILISWGADVNEKGEQSGDTPLHVACSLGLEKTVRHLITNHNALVNVENDQGRTPMVLAAEFDNLETLKILVQNGSDLQTYGSDAIYSAVRNDHIDIVEYLISKGADVNGVNLKGCAPIHRVNTLNCVKNLIRRGANIEKKSVKEGFTPLMFAAGDGLQDIVEYLIENGAKVNEEGNVLQHTALSVTSEYGHLECVKLLISKGSDVNKYGPFAVNFAAVRGHIAVVDYLISAGADIKKTVDNDMVPIHGATLENDLEVIKCLLNAGADINSKTGAQGWTPLILAAYKGNKDIIEYLVGKEAKVNEKDKNGRTALTYSSQEGHLECVKVLVNKGSNLREHGTFAIYLALRKKHTDVADYLLSAGTNINEITVDRALIHNATMSGDIKILKYLLNNGADINLKSARGNTSLILAACKGFNDIVAYLVENGAKLDIENELGHTALTMASLEGHLDCVKFLVEKGSDLRKYGRIACWVATEKSHTAVANYLTSVC